jgi:sugar phosphate isomerase/epimerase
MIGVATKFIPTAAHYEAAWKAGFRRVELWTSAAVLAAWTELAALGQSFAVDHALHFPNQLDLKADTIGNAAALYRALDCRAMVIHQPHFDRHAQALRQLDPGLRLAVENHKLTPERFRDWATRNPGLTLDVEHLWKYTLQDPPLDVLLAHVRGFLAEFAGKLLHVHLPGYLPGQPEHRPMYCSRDMVLGVLSLLEEVRFEGLIVSEVNPEFQNIHDLQMDVLLFQRWRTLHSPPLPSVGEGQG